MGRFYDDSAGPKFNRLKYRDRIPVSFENSHVAGLIMMRLLLGGLVGLWTSIVHADDWPQWMGKNRDGVWSETNILSTFPEKGPKKLWSQPISGGYSGPAVANGRVFVSDFQIKDGVIKNDPQTKGKLKGQERILCLDEKKGEILWTRVYDCDYEVSYPCGPRCTPTVDGERLYVVGAMGDLHCLKTSDGSIVWTKSFVRDYQATTPLWGFSGHPLIVGDQVICLVGGKDALYVSFDKSTGQEKWKSLNAKEPGYSSPRLMTVQGKPQMVVWYPNQMAGLDPETGRLIWSYDLEPKYGMTIMAPQTHGEELFAGGIGFSAVNLKLTSMGCEMVWKGNRDSAIYPVNMTPLIQGGVMYGVDQPGAFRAVDMKSGKRLWTSMLPVVGKDIAETNVSSGTVFLVRNNDQYFLFSETGHLIIAKLTAESYEEISRAQLLQPTGEAFGRKVVWSHPAFANGCIFARNDQEIVCYDLKK
jgi:outer membrane protein assembly factor BamB